MGPDTYFEIRGSIDLNTLSAQGAVRAGPHPLILRRVALVVLNDVAAGGIAIVKKRPTIGSASGETVVATFNLTTADVTGRVRYKDGLNVTINPGQELVCEVTDVTGVGDLADVIYQVEPSWEQLQNFTNCVAGV